MYLSSKKVNLWIFVEGRLITGLFYVSVYGPFIGRIAGGDTFNIFWSYHKWKDDPIIGRIADRSIIDNFWSDHKWEERPIYRKECRCKQD